MGSHSIHVSRRGGGRGVDANSMDSTIKSVIFFTYFCSISGIKTPYATLFCIYFFFYTIDTFAHQSFIHKHSLRPISVSSQLSAQWAKPSMGCRAEIRTRASALH
jgi:hypothetical protein